MSDDRCATPGCGHAKKHHWKQDYEIRACAHRYCDCTRYLTQDEIDGAIAEARALTRETKD